MFRKFFLSLVSTLERSVCWNRFLSADYFFECIFARLLVVLRLNTPCIADALPTQFDGSRKSRRAVSLAAVSRKYVFGAYSEAIFSLVLSHHRPDSSKSRNQVSQDYALASCFLDAKVKRSFEIVRLDFLHQRESASGIRASRSAVGSSDYG